MMDRDDFALEEDGRPQKIRYFSRESNLPLTVGLAVDTSGSQLHVLEAERRASYAFLDRMLRGQNRAFVASFDIDVQMLQGLTNSRELLSAAAFNQLRIPKRVDTLLYDAVHQTSDDPMRKQKGRKAFILLSDGFDQGSTTHLGSAIEYAQRADTLIYSVRFGLKMNKWRRLTLLGGPGAYFGGIRYVERGEATMRPLSLETGGRFFEVTKGQSIESIYGQIEEELRNQYSFGYVSDHQGNDKEYRKITLTAKRPGLIVQTRTGYYPR